MKYKLHFSIGIACLQTKQPNQAQFLHIILPFIVHSYLFSSCVCRSPFQENSSSIIHTIIHFNADLVYCIATSKKSWSFLLWHVVFPTVNPTAVIFSLCTRKWGIFLLVGDTLLSHYREFRVTLLTTTKVCMYFCIPGVET